MTINSDGILECSVECDVPSHMNYGAFMLQKISGYGTKLALIHGVTDHKVTYDVLVQEIVNVATSLTRLGVQKGDVVAICSENRPEFFVSLVAALCSGAVVTFINIAYSKGELIHTMGISKPKYIFMSLSTYKTFYDVIKENTSVEKFILFGHHEHHAENSIFYQDLAAEYVDPRTYKPTDFKGRVETALILYSSGTTGPPKGAKLTHSGLIIASHQVSPNKRHFNVLSIAPWSNTVGYINTIREIINGHTCIYLSRYNETDYLRAIEKYRAGYLLVVPPLVVMLAKSTNLSMYDVSSVQFLYSGGAPLDGSVISEAKERFPNLVNILQGYGMTEATGVMTEEHEGMVRNGSVGKLVMGNIVKVVDIETRKMLGPNEPGEICVKGPVLFGGFIGKDMSEYIDEDGYYKSGDIAYYDEEGFFFITDRLKELIKYKTWQVAPSELEAVILQHYGVRDVAVVGIPDAVAGELPMAFVVKKTAEELTEKEVIDFVASKVSPWKQLRGGVRFVDEIPKNGSGKILRRVIRDSLKKSKL